MHSPTPRGPSSIGVAAEGHPDKDADRVSGAVSGHTARPGPGARVAMETLITTGRVHVAGEGTVCAGVPALIRDAVLDIGHRQQIRTPGHGRGVRAAHSGHRHPRRYGPPWRRRPLGHEGPVSARFARAGRRTVGAALAGARRAEAEGDRGAASQGQARRSRTPGTPSSTRDVHRGPGAAASRHRFRSEDEPPAHRRCAHRLGTGRGAADLRVPPTASASSARL
ncbi:S-adenosylmethionine synthetase N-terminal domain-containing protein [Streptomyces sp. NPDC006863]|uniref:S-adenosylmethionine synthetase N-terminal domain-containing protein n=1 Tax=Streptomyces sp. NPDC006863 TaxID=3154779 RepID=UPI0033FFDAC1